MLVKGFWNLVCDAVMLLYPEFICSWAFDVDKNNIQFLVEDGDEKHMVLYFIRDDVKYDSARLRDTVRHIGQKIENELMDI